MCVLLSCGWFLGQESRGALAASVNMESRARWAAPPVGLNTRTHGLQ